nr:conserved hypothetical protein [uncultured archaeon GZfos1D1]
MSKVVCAETIRPSRLTDAARQKLSESLYDVHKRIFKGLDESGFDHYVVNSPANATKIFIYRNKPGKEIIGYFAVHRFEIFINDKLLVIFRAEAGLVPEYRHKNADISFWLKEAIKFKILYPSKEVYYLVSPINPSVYARLAKYIYKVYPKYNSVIPPDVEKLMMRLAGEFGLEMVDENNPLIRKVGWITQATDEEKTFWQSSTDPHVRFYIDSNPDFNKGNGLLTLVPLTFLNLFISFFRFIIFYTLKKKIRYNLQRLRA